MRSRLGRRQARPALSRGDSMRIRSFEVPVTRRSFLSSVSLSGSAFALGCAFEVASAQPGSGVPLNAWVRIEADNTVIVIVSQAEIGQGIATTMPAIIADEM